MVIEPMIEPEPPLRLAPTAVPFVAAGISAIVVGGLCAAVSRPTGWSDGPWVAAYLVLVAGVGQIGLSIGHAALAAPASERRLRAHLVLLNISALVVIAGTLASLPVAVTIGGALLMIALISFATATGAGQGRSWIRSSYVGLLVVLIVSIPIGLALSWVRA